MALTPHTRTGPSPYALMVIRALLQRPMRIPELMHATRLHQRTVQAQITWLLDAGAIYVHRRVRTGFNGRWAEYAPVVQVI